MTRDPDYWRRRYERAEAGRLAALDDVKQLSLRLVTAAADDLQQQVDALEQLMLKRTTLVNVEQSGRKVQFTFMRRGEIHRVECYADMSLNVAAVRKALIHD